MENPVVRTDVDRKKRLWAILVSSAMLVSACGSAPRQGTAPGKGERVATPEPQEPLEPGDLEAPPPVTIRYFDQSTQLEAWTYCYGNGCADGSPPKNPPDVGAPDEVIVEFPLPDWTFKASFTPAGKNCAREFPATLEPLGEGRFLLRPAGYADTYDVTLFGRGGGDLFVTFRWTTPSDGPLPKPKARAAILADHDGGVDSYGIELALTHLAATPEEASASITVEAENGEAITFDARLARGQCGEGSLYWDGPDDSGLAAAKLPGDRFTYRVVLRLDGERYEATATWPDDVIRGNEPSVSLDFIPDLPALR